MASDMNKWVGIGRLTRDAELKYTSGGMAVCKFAIAVNKRRKNGDQWCDEANFFDIVLWGKCGEAIYHLLVKGKQVAVEGELHQNRWEQDGQARSKVEINANNVQLLGGTGTAQTGTQQQGDAQNQYHRAKTTATIPQTGSATATGDGQQDFTDDIPF